MPTGQKGDRVSIMNTLNTIINSMSQSINESVIEVLTVLGFDHNEAVKIVVESDFDLITSSQLDPVDQF